MTYTERRKATIDKFINIDSIDDLKEVEAGLDEFAEYVRAEERERVRGEIEKLYEEFSVHPNENDREYMVQRFRLFTDKILSSLPLTDK